MNSVLFSSDSTEWATPQWLYDLLDGEFNFDLVPCATPDNAKCSCFYTKNENGLIKNWGGHRVFCNPPYGKNSISAWVEKGYIESRKPNTTVVMLLPVRTDTLWFHDYIYNKADIRFIRGRLHFNDSKNAAPFPSMIVIF